MSTLGGCLVLLRVIVGLREKGGCHMFRHAAATHMMNNDCDIQILMELLGHRSINSAQIYMTVAIDKLREVHKKTHPTGLH